MTKHKKFKELPFHEIYWELYNIISMIVGYPHIYELYKYNTLVRNIESNLNEIYSYFGLYDDDDFDV